MAHLILLEGNKNSGCFVEYKAKSPPSDFTYYLSRCPFFILNSLDHITMNDAQKYPATYVF